MTDERIAGAVTALRLAGIVAVAAALSACSMGSMFGGGPDSPTAAEQSATPAQIAQGQANAMPAIATECPPIKVTPGAEALFYYGGGHTGNPEDLHYEAHFENQTRNCVVSNGLITVKMGVIGRVLLGPAGKELSMTVPVRFSVQRNGTDVFNEKYPILVEISPPAQSAEFVKVVDNVAIPYLGGEDIEIYVGFDGGKSAASAPAAMRGSGN
jgi:hypothetical protein